MRNNYTPRSYLNALILIGILLSFSSHAQFITKWKTTTADESITIPTTGSGYYYNVDWGDASSVTGQIGDATHTYTTAGTHTVSITGTFPRIYFNDIAVSKNIIIEISQWGPNAWTNMNGAFYGCTNLNIMATDVPVLIGVTDMSSMFKDCNSLAPTGTAATALNTWNTASVTDMSYLFQRATAFDQDIGNWNTGAVRSMPLIFSGATAFNQDIGRWNTGVVWNMFGMFKEDSAFNQNIGSWNTGNVTEMTAMFSGAVAFNQDIGSWNTGKVRYMDGMFFNAYAFNQDIGSWNTGAVLDMSNMFYGTKAFNKNIGNWNTSTVRDMHGMFLNAAAFNQDIGGWNTGAVTSMSFMFSDAGAFNQDIGSWNTTQVTDMSFMFHTFQVAVFNKNIGNWNTGAVTSMTEMFRGAAAFNQNLGGWNIVKVTDMGNMLNNSGLSASNYDNTLIGWAAQTPKTNVPLGALNLKYCAGATARTTLTSTYNWTIIGDVLDCAAPLELISFTVQKSGANTVQINWSTGVESNVATLYVQHSSDATTWLPIYTCSPKGSNSNYEAIDNNPAVGNNYYRLLTTDKDGSMNYSPVRVLNFANSLSPRIFPNPTTGPITINYIKAGDKIVLTDLSGRKLLQKQSSNETQLLDLSSMANGIYFISITRDGKVVVNDKITKE